MRSWRPWTLRGEPPGGVRRASGFLAARLRGMATMPGWITKQQRAVQVDHRNATVDAARKDRIQQVRNRQERSERLAGAAARSEVDQLPGHALAPKVPTGNEPGLPELAGPQDLTATEIRQMRKAAAAELMSGDTSLISMMISMAVDWWGPAAAERIYGTGLVHHARQLAGMTSSSTFGIDRGAPVTSTDNASAPRPPASSALASASGGDLARVALHAAKARKTRSTASRPTKAARGTPTSRRPAARKPSTAAAAVDGAAVDPRFAHGPLGVLDGNGSLVT